MTELSRFVCIMCMFVIFLHSGAEARKNKYVSAARRQACQRGPCLGQDDTDPNCVLRCISATCWQRLYEHSPLEPGEVDIERARQFSTCAAAEVSCRAYV